MAKLESTPQRVFFLINNFNNVEGNRSLWDMKVTRSDDNRTLTNKYTEIVATKDSNDREFTSVKVRATKVQEVTVTNQDTGTFDRNILHQELSPMSWDDIDEEIVGIVNNYYESRDDLKVDLRERMINYADALSDFVSENPSSDTRIDENGIPEITIYGLPVDTVDSDECDCFDINVKSVPSLNDYEIEITSDCSVLSFTITELKKLMDKSLELDEILNYMRKYI